MMSCLCSGSSHKRSTSLGLMVVGNGPGFLGATNGAASVEKAMYLSSWRIMIYCYFCAGNAGELCNAGESCQKPLHD